jgi:hypothetical protein
VTETTYDRTRPISSARPIARRKARAAMSDGVEQPGPASTTESQGVSRGRRAMSLGSPGDRGIGRLMCGERLSMPHGDSCSGRQADEFVEFLSTLSKDTAAAHEQRR